MQSFLKTGKLGKDEVVKKSVKGRERDRPTPWVEKYRPRTVDDVVEQGEIVAVLKQCLQGADLPHFLFYGPPGTGKTSTIIAAARQLFGDIYKDRILELNASDDRGIQVIRDKVKTFSQLTASSIRPDGKPCPPYKIVILDEADSMTPAAQAALRRTMEKETRSTRFCLICNYVSCIIPPLASRCAKFRFKPLGEGVIRSRLELVCNQEGVTCGEGALTALVETSGGDLRRALTCLQSCARLKGGDPVTRDDVLEVSSVVPDTWISQFRKVCTVGDYTKAEDFINELILQAYPASQVLEQLHRSIISSDDLSDMTKAVICEKISVCSWRLQDGANESLQLIDLCCCMMKTLVASS